ncbi:Tautomerase/MIF superfamily [Mycena metata]|uniref:L-dopachrome isomerase n=1 Tax=Mycena metata TaxID=1033252 RepID=A0AAD7JVT0_9AGAR|nr:Tautomerase/MIF superfamily [Mycena metata]
MPYLELMVNVQVPDSEERALALEFSKLSAETLGKPEAYISVSITYNKTLTFGGTFDPAFQLTIMSLDNFDLEANERYSAAFSEFFKEKLNIPNDRG